MYILVVNPAAGAGKGLRVYESIKATSLFQQTDCVTYFTSYPGHAEEIARDAVELSDSTISCFIVIGGDGTLHEVWNGLQQYPHMRLGFIPAGSGNDFARGISTMQEERKLFQDIITNPNYVYYWGGTYKTDKASITPHRLFANSIGFGFDGEIVKKAHSARYRQWLHKWKLGSLVYVIALLHTVLSYRPKTLELTIDGQSKQYENVWMVTVGVHGFYGGGMKIIPEARMNSKHLSMIIIHNISKWKVLFLFLTVFRGSHTAFKEVEIVDVSTVALSSEEEIAYQVDGQYGCCKRCEVHKTEHARPVFQYKK
ncbi:diacylglycerol/lipid kinase family protein [Pontibacillus salicampi]|uniref:Diacylglycerol/lipid kinase family protein n=1 Tax=Pontibacillus salicampi TaxID=1449801 RepID=A0ABV6LIP8_9BACI